MAKRPINKAAVGFMICGVFMLLTLGMLALTFHSQRNEIERYTQYWRRDQRTIYDQQERITTLELALKQTQKEYDDIAIPHVKDMIYKVAKLYHLEPGFVTAIAQAENPRFKMDAQHVNEDGSTDRGLMQLNNCWFVNDLWFDPYVNVSAACAHISMLRGMGYNWWDTAVAYNCGVGKMKSPPSASISYADSVMRIWRESEPLNPANRGGK